MRCFYHPERDAAGTCSQCGKAGCHECLEDVGGAMLCKSCKGLAVAEVQRGQAAREVERDREMHKAKKRLRRSRFLFLGSAISISAIGTSPIDLRTLPEDDPKQRRPDITKARTILGWEPKVPLEEGLRRTIEYFQRGTPAP